MYLRLFQCEASDLGAAVFVENHAGGPIGVDQSAAKQIAPALTDPAQKVRSGFFRIRLNLISFAVVDRRWKRSLSNFT